MTLTTTNRRLTLRESLLMRARDTPTAGGEDEPPALARPTPHGVGCYDLRAAARQAGEGAPVSPLPFAGPPRCPACQNPLAGVRLHEPRLRWAGTMGLQCRGRRRDRRDRAGRPAHCETWLALTWNGAQLVVTLLSEHPHE